MDFAVSVYHKVRKKESEIMDQKLGFINEIKNYGTHR